MAFYKMICWRISRNGIQSISFRKLVDKSTIKRTLLDEAITETSEQQLA